MQMSICLNRRFRNFIITREDTECRLSIGGLAVRLPGKLAK